MIRVYFVIIYGFLSFVLGCTVTSLLSSQAVKERSTQDKLARQIEMQRRINEQLFLEVFNEKENLSRFDYDPANLNRLLDEITHTTNAGTKR